MLATAVYVISVLYELIEEELGRESGSIPLAFYVFHFAACICLLYWTCSKGSEFTSKTKHNGGSNKSRKSTLSVGAKKPNGKPALLNNGRNARNHAHAYQPIPSMPNQWMPDAIPASAEVTYVHHTLQRSLGSLPRASPRMLPVRTTPPVQILSPLPSLSHYKTSPMQQNSAASPVYGTTSRGQIEMPGRNGSLMRWEANYATATADSRTGSIRSEMSSFK